jgi:hypothetical protein
MTNSILKGGKRRGRRGSRRGRGSRRQNQNDQNQNGQNQNQNQQGGACGNSSSVAAAYGGSVPMTMPQAGGNALASSTYTAGNNIVKGGSVPMMGNLVAGGNTLFKGGNEHVVIPGMPPMPSATTGGNVLNELAVPAVLLYANNTFGKKKVYTGKKFRRSGKKSRRVRR